MNIHTSRPSKGGPPPLAPPEWTMTLAKNESGYLMCIVQCHGKPACRLSLNTNFSSAEEAEAALAMRARTWIAEYLARSTKTEGAMTSEATPRITHFEMAIALRQAGLAVPTHQKAGAALGAPDEAPGPAETFLMQCEAWKTAVEEAHRNWAAGQ